MHPIAGCVFCSKASPLGCMLAAGTLDIWDPGSLSSATPSHPRRMSPVLFSTPITTEQLSQLLLIPHASGT